MRVFPLLSSVAVLLVVSQAGAVTLYVSPDGVETNDCLSRATPCTLGAAASTAAAGDTVVLMDGLYQEALYVTNSGTSDQWITFEADECATPIIEGEGSGPNDDVQSTGVGSSEAEYIRFRGLVARGWNIGFGNGWADGVDSDAVSNGHWEIEYCISYSNGRTGFTFFSAPDFHLKNSISAHNGSSILHSWSSGVTLFEATGTNIVEGNISFENTDAERNTDGSGFIVDEASHNATFVNNIAFGNAGSCLRLTDSSGTVFVNNTCYHNSQFGSRATGPSNPSELYFTNSGVTVQGVTFMNNVIVGTGQAPAGEQAIVNQPTSGWTNNVVTTGSVSYFTDPDGANPNFVPASGATELIGQGSSGGGVPTSDIGFDPKCIVKRAPAMVGAVARESWWQYDIDIAYVQSIGGVAACFNAKARSGSPDIGAYSSGDVTTVTPGSCVPPEIPVGTGGAAGTGGTAGTGGVVTTAGTGGVVAGGTGGAVTTAGTGGIVTTAGTGGVVTAAGTGGIVTTAGAGGVVTAAGTGGVVITAGTGGIVTAGMGGVVGVATGGAGGVGGPAAGGTPGVGGAFSGGTPGAGGTLTGGAFGVGGAFSGGTPGVGGSLTGGTAAGTPIGGIGADSSAFNPPNGSTDDDGGCGCRLAPVPDHRGWLATLSVLGVGLLARRRRTIRARR